MDLIDVRRVERILVEALEEEATPAAASAIGFAGDHAMVPPGRFARPGNVFAIPAATNQSEGRLL